MEEGRQDSLIKPGYNIHKRVALQSRFVPRKHDAQILAIFLIRNDALPTRKPCQCSESHRLSKI